jgi:hypothetical protein
MRGNRRRGRRGSRVTEETRASRLRRNFSDESTSATPCGRMFWNIALRRRRAWVSRWDGLGRQVEERAALDRLDASEREGR